MSMSGYFTYGQNDQEEHNKFDRPRKEEKKILSSTTIIVASITLFYCFVRVYVGRKFCASRDLDQTVIVKYEKITRYEHTW